MLTSKNVNTNDLIHLFLNRNTNPCVKVENTYKPKKNGKNGKRKATQSNS